METRPLTPPSPEEAREIRESLKGDSPPDLPTLVDFILRAQTSLAVERRKKDSPTDVDFF